VHLHLVQNEAGPHHEHQISAAHHQTVVSLQIEVLGICLSASRVEVQGIPYIYHPMAVCCGDVDVDVAGTCILQGISAMDVKETYDLEDGLRTY
jgi:hypothetical protein